MVLNNEKTYIENNILANHTRPPHTGIRKIIWYLIRYYYTSFKDKSWQEYFDFIRTKMEEFNFSYVEYQEYQYADYIKKNCKKMLKGEIAELREINEVNITKDEMDLISTCKTERQRKVLFTLYVLAKVYGYNSGWVNFKVSEIFTLANVSLNYYDRLFLLHEIYSAGLIQINHMINKQGFKVEFKPESDTAVTIKNFNNIGRQYIAATKPGYVCCEKCQKLFKTKNRTGRPIKYCDECATIVHKEQKLKSQNRIRNEDKKKNQQTL